MQLLELADPQEWTVHRSDCVRCEGAVGTAVDFSLASELTAAAV